MSKELGIKRNEFIIMVLLIACSTLFLTYMFVVSSAGNGRITRRINSNGYILSLIKNFDFEIHTYPRYATADIFSQDVEVVENI